ncbi:MAG: hypothetical protein ACE5EZ_03615 [Thermodesulfobacteriota bacterium]
MMVRQRFLDELGKSENIPNVILELRLKGGTRYLGIHGNRPPLIHYRADGTYRADADIFAVGSDTLHFIDGVVKSVSSLQNRIDPSKGFATRGELKAVISGRDNFKPIIRDEFLKNTEVIRKDGFMAPGFTYGDYVSTFSGRISDWSRKGDELTLTIADTLADVASTDLPVSNSNGTQVLDYTNWHPGEIMKDLLSEKLGMDLSAINMASFDTESSLWLNGWSFSRVLTEPVEVNKILNELQIETNSFIVHDGLSVNMKVFAPPPPGTTVEKWSEGTHVIEDTITQKSGYKDKFFNRVVVYFDYKGSGGSTDNFESAVIAVDAASQDTSQWNEISTKTIKSKWIRSLTHSQPANITGATVYHLSKSNGPGAGVLAFTPVANGKHTFTWAPPGEAAGGPVSVTSAGKYTLYSSDGSKWIKLVVDYAALPTQVSSDTITISTLNGLSMATQLAQKILNRYRDPVSTISFEMDINNIVYDSNFIRPTDLKDITTDEASEHGTSTWNNERVMITRVRPDMSRHRVRVEAVKTQLYRRYGFVAPVGQPDYSTANKSERERAYIGDSSNKVNGGTEDGYIIW